MDEEYDVIVLGTGLKECVLSGLLSVSGKKVLHMDRNNYYGGESTSMSPLEKLFEMYGKAESFGAKDYGRARDWNVDLIPKFIMADGELVKMLIHSGVTRYMEFKSVEGSYVFRGNKIHKIPSTEAEAFKTSLVGMLQKKAFKTFVNVVVDSTEEGCVNKKGYKQGMTFEAFVDLFGLAVVRDVIGHAIALHIDDDYTQKPCEETIKRLKLYFESVQRYGKSPYLYPLYGLGELPQGFARLSAIYGGTYMLDKPIDEIVMEDGKLVGVKSQGETARTKMVIGDPSYFPDRVKKTGQVVRKICILDHPVVDDSLKSIGLSAQIIFPCSQVPGRKSDIYVCCVSYAHQVASKGHFIAIASCRVETDNPEKELDVAMKYIGPIKEHFVSVSDLYEPLSDGKEDNIFITTSYDATTHFESTCCNIKEVYSRVTGEPCDFSKVKPDL